MAKREPIRLVGPDGRPEQLTRKLLKQEFVRGPLHDFLLRVGAWFEGAWKQRVSVGVSGAYRGSIRHQVDSFKSVTIFSPIKYAAFREFGTGPGHRPGPRARYWPPRQALARWAQLKGIPVFLVQRAIWRRGTKAENAIGQSITASRGPLRRMVDRLASDIGIKWGQK